MDNDPGSLPLGLFIPWRRRILLIVLGVLSAAALPSLYILPALWIGLSGFAFLCVRAKTVRAAFADGWCFGLGWFGAGFYWIGYAFLVDAERYGWLMPLAVFGISAGMSLYTGLVSAVVRALRPSPAYLVPVFAGVWALAEWLRGTLFTGFPWNPLASVWGLSPEILQAAAWIGAPGLSFLTALVSVAPVLLLPRPRAASTGARVALALLVLVIPSLWLAGTMRLSGSEAADREDLVVRIVQPAIAQEKKWVTELRRNHVLKQMAMSRRRPVMDRAPALVVWAETNVPYVIDEQSPVPAALAAAVPSGGHLIFGAVRRDALGAVYNSLFVIDDDGRVIDHFDKFHLVPFGEYVPFRGILPIDKLTAGRGDFAAGPGPKTLDVAGLVAFAPIICYEVIFSGNVTDPDRRPQWIVNITNDAWFGPSSGPRQHLVQAQLRAVEEGLPVVRAANTGISAIIDAYGRIRHRLDLGAQGVVDGAMPSPIPPTGYVLTGKLPVLLVFLLSALSPLLGGLCRRLFRHVGERA